MSFAPDGEARGWTPALFSSGTNKRFAIWGYLPLSAIVLAGLMVQPYFDLHAWGPLALAALLLPLLYWSSYRGSTRAAFASLLVGLLFCVWLHSLAAINVYAYAGRWRDAVLSIDGWRFSRSVFEAGYVQSCVTRATAWALVGVLSAWVGLHASRSNKALFAWLSLYATVAAMAQFAVGSTGGWHLYQPWFRWAVPALLAAIGIFAHLHLRRRSGREARALLVTLHGTVMLTAFCMGAYFHGVFALLHDTAPSGISVTFVP